MKLTGKCKKDFELWLYSQEKYQYVVLQAFDDRTILADIICGYNTPLSIQFAVIQEFSDTNKITLQIETKTLNTSEKIFTYNIWGHLGTFHSRSKAMEGCIEKFNELYNEQHK